MRKGLAGLMALLLLLCAMPSLCGADESGSTYQMETKGHAVPRRKWLSRQAESP